MRLAPSSLASSSSRPLLAPAKSTQPRRPAAPAANRRRRPLASVAVSAQQQASDARGAIDAGIDLMQAGDPRAALAEFGRALTLPGTGLKRYRCVQQNAKSKSESGKKETRNASSKKG